MSKAIFCALAPWAMVLNKLFQLSIINVRKKIEGNVIGVAEFMSRVIFLINDFVMMNQAFVLKGIHSLNKRLMVTILGHDDKVPAVLFDQRNGRVVRI
ncbi:hypothetical protein [Thalassotalea sp. G20_0]|uniref:hypothetical protein n=1 Tax=Thalassotalea sp. G20_0 TaxID=2821093 RepID=UPI001AD9C7D7|nr:hypothetical protein [Thalassotalea sp. G20_0]